MSTEKQDRGSPGLSHQVPPRPPQDARLSETCYADLELLPWPVLEEPVQPRQMEVEYSTVVSARAQLPAWGPCAMCARGITVGCGSRQRDEGLGWWCYVPPGHSHTENGAGADCGRARCHCGWGVGVGWEPEGLSGWPVSIALTANKVQLL